MDQTGYFEEVNGGTLFLDEFNSMSLSMQSKLLRDFQKGFFTVCQPLQLISRL